MKTIVSNEFIQILEYHKSIIKIVWNVPDGTNDDEIKPHFDQIFNT